MPYVSKPDNSHNLENTNPVEVFPTKCPSCGIVLEISESGKSALCSNMACKQRNIARIVSMLKKLNVKDFSDAYLLQIGKYTLSDMMNLSVDEIQFLGEITSQKFIERMNQLKLQPIYDYKIIGSLGFTDIGVRKWKLILNKYTLDEILSFTEEQLRDALLNIKGIGPATVDTIVSEFKFFKADIDTILKMPNILKSKGVKSGKSIRFTGFRNEELVNTLNDMGYDANGDSGVTKSTDILLVPFEGYTSPKTVKASANNIMIIPINDFTNNMDKYL